MGWLGYTPYKFDAFEKAHENDPHRNALEHLNCSKTLPQKYLRALSNDIELDTRGLIEKKDRKKSADLAKARNYAKQMIVEHIFFDTYKTILLKEENIDFAIMKCESERECSASLKHSEGEQLFEKAKNILTGLRAGKSAEDGIDGIGTSLSENAVLAAPILLAEVYRHLGYNDATAAAYAKEDIRTINEGMSKFISSRFMIEAMPIKDEKAATTTWQDTVEETSIENPAAIKSSPQSRA